MLKKSLNGTWSLFWTDYERGGRLKKYLDPQADMSHAFEAVVPGEVHLDLMKAGVLEDPAIGLNYLKARWVEEMAYFYRRVFQVDPIKPGERAWLIFERLELAANIYLNGTKVGSHSNAFYPLRIDITDHIKPGENLLVVEIESGLYQVSERPGIGYGGHENSRLHKRHWQRQVQSTFGWDWSARLLNIGITGDVFLEVCQDVRLDRMTAFSELSDNLQTGDVTVRLFIEGLKDQPQRGQLIINLEGTGCTDTIDVEIRSGLQRIEAKIALEKPNLWWPAGHGSQPMYTVQATLSLEGRILFNERRRIGFRHVRVNQDPHPNGGRFFIIEVNRKPIFCKGGNFVPADFIAARLDASRYQTLIRQALDANFNLMRVWGGGLYESDDFFNLCDETGLLVWQEFIFACAKYPGNDPVFHADVEREAVHQIRRLAHHPSLIVWCGNNEIEVMHSWKSDRAVPTTDYGLFHLTLPRLLKIEDPTRYYQASSPISPDCVPPNQDDQGDQHPWSIGFDNNDFREYRKMICRFPNEGGFLGPTALPTVKACLEPGATSAGSFAWELHDNSVAYWFNNSAPDMMLEQWLGKNIRDLSLEDYVFYAGLLQGEALGEYIRNFRRRMFDSASAIFWMFNDCWPMVRSWTILDYYLRRTPSYHPVRRAFNPVTLAIAEENGKVRIYGINEGTELNADLRFGLFALSGGYPLDRSQSVRLSANASAVIGEFDREIWNQSGLNTHGAFALLSRDNREIAREKLFLPLFREMNWPKADVRVRREGSLAVFQSDSFAWRISLDLDGEKSYPDNFFDLLPGIPYRVEWPENLSDPTILKIGNL